MRDIKYIIVGKGVQNICAQEYKKFYFSPSFFFNVDISFNIKDRLLRFFVVVIGMIMEGNVSQIFYLGPSFFFLCDLENDVYKIYKMFPDFYNKIKTRA